MFIEDRSGTVTIIDGEDGSGISEAISCVLPTEVETLSLVEADLYVLNDEPPSDGANLRDVSAVLSCGNVTNLDLTGVSMDLLLISALVLNCPKLRHFCLTAITDPDDGASLLALASSPTLETLGVACWDKLSNDSVRQIVSGCRSLRSMVVSHCTALSITSVVAAELRSPPAPFCFLAHPQCVPLCLPPNRKCIKCIADQIEGDAEFAASLEL